MISFVLFVLPFVIVAVGFLLILLSEIKGD